MEVEQTQTEAAPQAAPQPVTVVETPTPTIDDTMSAVFDKMNPPRDSDSGKFTAKDKPAEGAEIVGDAAEIVSDQVATEATPEPAKPAIGMPQSWPSEKQALWDASPPEVREFVAQREGEAHKRISELGETAKEAERYRNLFSRHQHALEGAPPDQVIENLLATKSAFMRDRVGTFVQLANQLGVDLSQFAQPQMQLTGDARIDALIHRVDELTRANANLQTHMTQSAQAQERQRARTVESQVEKFAKGKDYWPKIESEVINQIYALKTANPDWDHEMVLKEAETRALKLTGVQEELERTAKEAEAKKKEAEAKKKADDAKRLASINVKSSAGKSPQNAKTDIWSSDSWSALYDKAQATG